jgi:hypothetical protein
MDVRVREAVDADRVETGCTCCKAFATLADRHEGAQRRVHPLGGLLTR